MELYPYKSTNGFMEPIALQNHLVAIHFVKDVIYRRVAFFEAITPTQVIDLGALGAGLTSARTNVTALDCYDQEFGQFRWYCLDNAQIRVFTPRGIAKGDLKTIQAVIPPNIGAINPDLSLTEMFVWQDNRPAIEAINGGGVALAAVRMVAMGFRYRTEELGNPVTYEEAKVIAQLKQEQNFASKQPAELITIAIQQNRISCTHIWASGMGAGR
jgi:hypothetical protein